MSYTGAGVLFTNRTIALGGYNPYKKCISGIGGKRSAVDGTPLETAFREAVEEFFDIDEVPSLLIKTLTITFSCPDMMLCSDYTVFVYSFNDLTRFLQLCKVFGLVSPIYSLFPETLEQLLINRTYNGGEISHIVIVPVVESALTLDPFFQEDLEKICMK